jgi:hypothetical protein
MGTPGGPACSDRDVCPGDVLLDLLDDGLMSL